MLPRIKISQAYTPGLRGAGPGVLRASGHPDPDKIPLSKMLIFFSRTRIPGGSGSGLTFSNRGKPVQTFSPRAYPQIGSFPHLLESGHPLLFFCTQPHVRWSLNPRST
jgi:hypothetical protein